MERDIDDGARGRIWDAAIRVIADKGVQAARIKDIAQAAGVSDGALYRHWPSKADLVGALFTLGYAGMAERLRTAAGTGTPTERLCRLIRAACALYEEDREGSQFLLLHQREGLPLVPDGADTPVRVVEEIVAEGIADGSIRGPDVRVPTDLVVGTLVMSAQSRVYGRQDRPMTDVADAIIDLVLCGLAGRRE